MLFSPLIGLLMRKIDQRKISKSEEKKSILAILDPIVDLEDSDARDWFWSFQYKSLCNQFLVRSIKRIG